jgi:hypothetical protein
LSQLKNGKTHRSCHRSTVDALFSNNTQSNSNTEEPAEPSKAPSVLFGASEVKELEFAIKDFTSA